MAEGSGALEDLDGAERAAIFLLTLGEQSAAAVLKHMGPKEVQQVGMAMANIKNVSKAVVGQVLEDFVATVQEQTSLGVSSEDYIRSVLIKALGEEKASALIDRILLGRNSKGLDALKWMDARAVAESIRDEHPQIIAIVLTYLESDHAAEVLSYLPDAMRTELLIRVAQLDSIQPSALDELDEILEKQFANNKAITSANVGGVKLAANILNFMDTAIEGEILEQLSSKDEELGQQIQELMFVFGDLASVDDRGIQALLREVSSDSLITALKGADEVLKEKIFKNMSKRAAETLRDDLDAKGPVRLSEVEAAQKEILVIARRMSESGDLMLGNKGGGGYV